MDDGPWDPSSYVSGSLVPLRPRSGHGSQRSAKGVAQSLWGVGREGFLE